MLHEDDTVCRSQAHLQEKLSHVTHKIIACFKYLASMCATDGSPPQLTHKIYQDRHQGEQGCWGLFPELTASVTSCEANSNGPKTD